MGFLQPVFDVIAIPLGFLMRWCYLFVNDLLHLPVSYMFALFAFAIITKILMFPLSLKQQRSQAVSAAYQPMVNEINQKFARDPKRRAEELEKLQKEYGYNPASGCLPLLIQLPVMFGLVEVVYRPLSYMLRIPAEVITALSEKVTALSSTEPVARYMETTIINFVKTRPGDFAGLAVEGVTGEALGGYVRSIGDLSMSLGSVNLWENPVFGWNPSLWIPVFSIITMLFSSVVTMWAASGRQQDKKTMRTGLITSLSTTVLFSVFMFQYPTALSLYWGFSNLIMMLQSFILRRMVNADTVKAEAEQRIEERKQKAKEAKKVKVVTKTGETSEQELAGAELARYRLQRARELDEERYRD